MVREELAVTGSGATVTLSEAPVAGSVVVYKADDDCGTSLAITGDSTAITLTSALTDGDKVIAYYLKEVKMVLKESTSSLQVSLRTLLFMEILL